MNKQEFYKLVAPHTLTTEPRINALWDALEHIRINNIQGDLVECGVYKGGNILGIMDYLHYWGMDRTVWAYDTFQGMTPPTKEDVDLHGTPAEVFYPACIATLEEVQKLFATSPFNRIKNLRTIVGDICHTITQYKPEKISLLRLDTDWYASTLVELQFLYPKLSQNGIMIIDDYGHWKGASQATNEYFNGTLPNYTQIDYTAIKIVKE